MNTLKNHDILKNISLFINYKHIWYLSIFSKNISYNDNYWRYRGKNIYECDKINNKQEYELYYETFFEDGSDTKEYNINAYYIKSPTVYAFSDKFNCFIPNVP